MHRHIIIVGAPVETGAGRRGCLMGPDALRVAGLGQALIGLGCTVEDRGNLTPPRIPPVPAPFGHIRNLTEGVAWSMALETAAHDAAATGAFPVFVGGDHSLALGTVPGLARHAQARGRPLFVLWLDAHADFHRLDTTTSGNLHGLPLAYVTGRESFAGIFPELTAPVPPENVCLLGVRSIDPAERRALAQTPIAVHDMHFIDSFGIERPLLEFLGRVRAAGGMLHVSFDVDCLDPAIAPAVGTRVAGGIRLPEARRIMTILSESGLVSSLDLAELNPALDLCGQTARLLVDLTAALIGRQAVPLNRSA